MTHETFKIAYFNDDAVAKAIGRQMDMAHNALVEQGIIEDSSIVYWAMCNVAWEAPPRSPLFRLN